MALINPAWCHCRYADERLIKFLEECCLMGPHFKALWELDSEERSIIYDHVCQQIMKLSDASCDSSEGREDFECSQTISEPKWSDWEGICEPQKSAIGTLFMSLPECNSTGSILDNKISVAHKEIKEQLDCYWVEGCTLNGEPLTWWREHAHGTHAWKTLQRADWLYVEHQFHPKGCSQQQETS